MSSTSDVAAHRRLDADFAAEVLAEIYTYPRRRLWVAVALWLLLGWVGGHRFYLGRYGTGLLMMVSGGGLLVWWVVDGFYIASFVRDYNEDQALRERVRQPPRELDFMPPLSRDVLSKPPEWTERWQAGSAPRSALRLAGDIMVLLLTGLGLGSIAGSAGVYEAVVAVAVLAALTAVGASAGGLQHLPVARELIRWSHRLRLFYYYNKPGNPLALLFRPLTAAVLAPFRRRDRAEVKLYLQLGGVLTLFFLLIDLIEAVAADGLGALSPGSLFGLWIREATTTFVVIYAFATPIGAVLTLHLLMRRTHTVPRLLSGLVVVAMVVGMLM
ncbi:MAG TPA: TM2 domain-containing protein [Longimicrobiales bacterium]|nr:TM2 domain-containing protein [Longimicrobiales bacterium]